MSRVTVSSSTVTTDPFSTLTVQSHGFTNGVLLVQNNGKATSSFRIKNQAATVITPADLSIAAGATATFALSKLTPGSTTNYNLERLEYGSYVPQSADPTNVNNMTSITTDLMSMSISTGSVHATIAFNIPATVTPVPEVVVLIQNKTDFDANTTANMQLISVPTSTGAQAIAISGLSAATAYTAVLMTRDRSTPNTHYSDGFAENTIDMKNFTTSLSGGLTIGTPFCSYVTLTWSGDSSEVYRVVDGKGAVVAPDGPPSTLLVNGLMPGTNYTFVLQLKNGSTYQNTATATCTTPTTTLTIQGVTDTQCTCSWTSVYDKAAYELTVTSSASKTVVQTIDTSALTQLVKGLNPSNTYAINLAVIENGSSTTVSRAALGTADPTPAPTQSAPSSASSSNSSDYNVDSDNNNSNSNNSSSNNNSVQSIKIANVPDHIMEAAKKANSVILPGKTSHIEIAVVVCLACIAGYGVYRSSHASK
jgi:hypothetical protein